MATCRLRVFCLIIIVGCCAAVPNSSQVDIIMVDISVKSQLAVVTVMYHVCGMSRMTHVTLSLTCDCHHETRQHSTVTPTDDDEGGGAT